MRNGTSRSVGKSHAVVMVRESGCTVIRLELRRRPGRWFPCGRAPPARLHFPSGRQKEPALNPMLTVVVPVHNAQTSLTETVEHLLEILPELTSQFEVVLVDDGSTDSTNESAHEATLRFPQVQLLVQPARLGPQEALRSSLRYARGEWLLLVQPRAELDLHEIRKLWDRRAEDAAIFAQTNMRGPLGSIPALPVKNQAEAVTPDVLLTARRLLVAWHQSGDRQGVLTYLRSRGFGVKNVELRPLRRRTDWVRPATTVQSGLLTARPSQTTARRAEAAEPTAAAAKRPHVLSHHLLTKLKALAWGE